MGVLAWIILGGLAGWIASIIMNTNEDQGIFLNIVVGIVGAVLGGFIVQICIQSLDFIDHDDFAVGESYIDC